LSIGGNTNIFLVTKLWDITGDKAVPLHLVQVMKRLYRNNEIITYNGTRVRRNTEVINQGGK
jgi:hypothetical protein